MRFHQGGDDVVIVQNVIEVKLAFFAVFEPLLSGLIATDVKLPSNFWHVRKFLGVVDGDVAVGVTGHGPVIFVDAVGDDVIACAFKFTEGR